VKSGLWVESDIIKSWDLFINFYKHFFFYIAMGHMHLNLTLSFVFIFLKMQVALILWLLMLGTFVHHYFGKMASGPSGPMPEKGNINQIRLVSLFIPSYLWSQTWCSKFWFSRWYLNDIIPWSQGDSPLEKRRRTDTLQAGSDKPFGGETGGLSKDKITNNSKKPEEPRPLALSQRDMSFNIGKSVIENKTEAVAFKRPGLQKEGSKVVYGVPKHGKKKKFMEVSKHYVAGQSDKISYASSRVASSRVVKHTGPPLPRPRDNTSKTDQRGRRVGKIRSRGPPKPSKPQSIAANTISDKDSLPMPAPNSGVFERNFAFMGSTTSTSNTEKSTTEKNKAALGPVPRTEDLSVSGMKAASTAPTSKQDVPTTSRTKRRHVPSVDNRSIHKTSERPDSAEPKRTSSDSAEPRRSNRQIQPTSRVSTGNTSMLQVENVCYMWAIWDLLHSLFLVVWFDVWKYTICAWSFVLRDILM
jgi:hypothetical protein